MITDESTLINALANSANRLVLDKASIANQLLGGFTSLWRATGQPGQAAIPTAAALCDKTLVGSLQWPNQTDPVKSYIGWFAMVSGNSMTTPEIHDRLCHLGGLVFNVATAQTAVLDPTALSIPNARRGDSNFSDIQWWIESYTAGGATASNATIGVVYNDSSTGNLNVVAVGGTLQAGRMLPLNSLIPTAKSGLYIKSIASVQLSVSTGTAGNFGFTATRPRTTLPLPLANFSQSFDWAQLGLPDIANDSCLQIITLCGTTSSGTLRGSGKLING